MDDNVQNETAHAPAHTVRIGPLRCAIWANQTKNGVMHNSVLTRTYRDNDGEFRETPSLRRDDLLAAGKLLDMAHTWICRTEQEQRRSDDSGTTD